MRKSGPRLWRWEDDDGQVEAENDHVADAATVVAVDAGCGSQAAAAGLDGEVRLAAFPVQALRVLGEQEEAALNSFAAEYEAVATPYRRRPTERRSPEGRSRRGGSAGGSSPATGAACADRPRAGLAPAPLVEPFTSP